MESEFYTPIPDGYKSGKTKYLIITGSVMSGLGKGIFSASIGKLLQDNGYVCSPIKMDGYLNVDAGTLNPYRHGEVFVLDDGLECDMDLGTYERFLNKNLSEQNYLTGGKIFKEVLKREREGGYLGRDVQFIPHVTGEIKLFLRNLAMNTKADVVAVEVGGTVGDIENEYFFEAMRQLAYEEGEGNSCFVNVTYVLEPHFLGEQKSKAAQLGIKRLMEKGIQPDIIACRATNPVTYKVREKISIYSNVPVENVVSCHDRKSIYTVPTMLKEAGIDKSVMEILKLKNKPRPESKEWLDFVKNTTSRKKEVTIGMTGKYTGLRDSYASIIKALEHSGSKFRTNVKIKWIETTEIEKGKKNVVDELKDVSGIIVPGGFGKRGTEGKIKCIEYARKNNLPYLGLCLGFQMAMIEFARNVCGLKDANSTEMESDPKHPVIDILPEQKKIEGLGGNMRLGGRDVLVKKDTKAYKLYGNKTTVRERFRHRYECNPEYIPVLEKNGLVFSGKAPKVPIMQILELPKHPFFVGVQFHPEFTSRPLAPNPLYMGFVEAAIKFGK
ncbi:CTP synthase (glutamine hydrolyzing) [Candidatus Woesearchaeota archaeon]|nr:CTP synthase (glutamine hydrolyzing) [Candidatus Woesearchaeota archaeon]